MENLIEFAHSTNQWNFLFYIIAVSIKLSQKENYFSILSKYLLWMLTQPTICYNNYYYCVIITVNTNGHFGLYYNGYIKKNVKTFQAYHCEY
jgi:hypothetical protein